MNGVGTHLHTIFRWWGFKPTDRCNCASLRKHYDQMGTQWCQEHIDKIVNDILKEAKNRKKNLTADLQSLLPSLSLLIPKSTQKFVLKRIVQVCINRTVKNQ